MPINSPNALKFIELTILKCMHTYLFFVSYSKDVMKYFCVGSCSAGVRQPVYHPLPPGATRPPHGSPESALAQLMQCEQRILHGAPGMPHYREAGPPTRPWLAHRHGPPPAQTFIPVSHHTEDRWHTHEGWWWLFKTASIVFTCI